MITNIKQDDFSKIQNWDFKKEIKKEDYRNDFPDYETLLTAYIDSQSLINSLLLIFSLIIKILTITNQINRLSFPKLSQNTRAKRDPMSIKIYRALLKAAKGSTYSKIRLRIAFCILFITGINLKVLLSLRVHQLTTLREKGWIAIDKDGIESNDSKAYLTKIGRRYLKEREKDFTSLFLTKTSDDFIFTSQRKPYKRLTRETLTREINKVMSRVSHELPEKTNITSYSFRVGVITALWQNPTVIKSIQKTFDNN